MSNKNTITDDQVEIKQILLKNQKTLENISDNLEKMNTVLERLLSVAQREDYIFAPSEPLKASSGLISRKTVPVFDFDMLNPYPDLKEINEQLIRDLQSDQTKQSLVLAILKHANQRATADELADELGLARSTCALYLNKLVEKKVLGKERGNAILEEANRKIYFYTKGHSASELVEEMTPTE
ncbi:MAG: winged helix-turn-helix transcriptional regulator [Candidatus Odinarchaeota archaeon]